MYTGGYIVKYCKIYREYRKPYDNDYITVVMWPAQWLLESVHIDFAIVSYKL